MSYEGNPLAWGGKGSAPSAPVGVEADILRIVNTAIEVCNDRDRPAMAEDLEAVRLYVEQASANLAQQPAAVDEAVIRYALDHARDLDDGVARVVAALAAQPAEIEALRAEVERLQSAFEQAVEADKDEEVQRLHAEKVAHFIARTDAEAEVKALRAEVEIAKGQGEFYRTQRNAQQRKAARLEEALQWYVDNDDTNEGQEGNEFWLAGRDRARALLREQQEDYWPKLEGKGGTDWTGFDG